LRYSTRAILRRRRGMVLPQIKTAPNVADFVHSSARFASAPHRVELTHSDWVGYVTERSCHEHFSYAHVYRLLCPPLQNGAVAVCLQPHR
jgi:hypothetical protein